jgi:iron complex transport system ATP-binding protein
MTDLLRAANLTFAYGDQPTLRGVSVSLQSNQIVALIGPNGSGKSTLIKVLLGHLHGQGTIQWEGRLLASWSRRDLAKRVAYLPQSPVYEIGQTVADVLRLGRAPYWAAFGIESPRDAQVVRQVSAQLGLDDLLHRPMDALSGGQRQRAFIGRCLVQEPATLLLDEPDTFLDLRRQVELGQTLRSLARDRAIGIVWASHDLNSAAAFADRLVLLRDGAVVGEGTPSEVLRADLLSEVYGVALERIDREGRPPIILPLP